MTGKSTAHIVSGHLHEYSSQEKARASAWFFKTGSGEYGHGDVFAGVSVPNQRKIAKQFTDLSLDEINKLLQSKVHEHRLTGLLILVAQYRAADAKTKKALTKFYLSRKNRINSWDLVDSSAPYILGDYLLSANRVVLYTLARSTNLWHRRIAIISTFSFIKEGEYRDTLNIAEILLEDTQDLIHKAVGWMLREVGNKSLSTEERFLKKHAVIMPRTMLRYAIEKFPENKRKMYLRLHSR
ncbi:DNA alkylation repair protein [Candidatus Kaiserbacteria bacterium RIFCSPHIGHO2_02_FULL_55_17]|uniref:DNA alkylation repair protein n=1 Tax=Candidatus Kaiserbacteria bacterium RIFCSPHIGHO2_02_FULL_55_17 TaxID=1798496 RepID=A0A1F6DRW6_9BACT|nr:MAG: DNA alkylation repair protein [Candidatus Kaiserbacteria bacterium RIFCSPHIGHO2_02_FULL_55_17]